MAALTAIAVTLAWIAWRVIATLDGAALWLGIPLLLLEVHALASLCLHTLDLWNIDAAPPTTPLREEARVAIRGGTGGRGSSRSYPNRRGRTSTRTGR